MKYILNKVIHRFNATPNALEVHLAIESDDPNSQDFGMITLQIELDDPKALTLAAIERMAIERAKTLLKQ